MNVRRIFCVPPVPLWLVAAIAIAGAPPRLHAVQFSRGDLSGSFDSTFSVGGLYRLHDPKPLYYATSARFEGVPGTQNSVNVDDG
ncbi:MAG TPA: DUF1302 family protein, partial [Opitutus sp.]|nr:DUF1302 family protein [Opitutus sp.]